MSKHTPGPWLVATTPSGKSKVTDANGFSICNTTAGPYKQQTIDATLIAAAPDLLEALRAAFWVLSDAFGHASAPYQQTAHAALNEARAALAKAEGRKP